MKDEVKVVIDVFRSSLSGDWRWQMSHVNGKIQGSSSEGYGKRIDCLHNLRVVTGWSPPVPIRSDAPSFSWDVTLKLARGSKPR